MSSGSGDSVIMLDKNKILKLFNNNRRANKEIRLTKELSKAFPKYFPKFYKEGIDFSGRRYMIIKRFNQISLDDILEEKVKFSVNNIIKICKNLLKFYIDLRKEYPYFLHNDLHQNNIFITKDFKVKIIDLGLATINEQTYFKKRKFLPLKLFKKIEYENISDIFYTYENFDLKTLYIIIKLLLKKNNIEFKLCRIIKHCYEEILNLEKENK